MKNKTLPLLVLDVLLAILAVLISYGIRFYGVTFTALSFEFVRGVLGTNQLVWLFGFSMGFCIYIMGGYDFRFSARQLSINTIVGSGTAALGMVLLSYLAAFERAGVFGRGVLGLSLLVFSALALGWRWLYFSRMPPSARRVLFIVQDRDFDVLREEIARSHSRDRFVIAGLSQRYVPDLESRGISHHPLSALDKLIGLTWNEIVVNAGFLEAGARRLLLQKRLRGQRVRNLIDYFEYHREKLPVDLLSDEWFLTVDGFAMLRNPTRARLKRVADFSLALIALALLLPMMLIIALVIRLESPGSPLFQQIRTGVGERRFKLFKFRSMRRDAEADGRAQWAAVGDSRVTGFGRIMRKTRIDELPQLWNILIGDMSFVGPRPERPEFDQDLIKLIPHYEMRFSVRPGLTGWAQINYPYGASVEDSKQKLQFDLYYIKNYSLMLDLDIFVKTIRVVVFGAGR